MAEDDRDSTAEGVSTPDAESALREERDLYQDLVDAQPGGIYRLRIRPAERLATEPWRSAVYSFDFISERFSEIFGVTRAELQRNPGIIPDLIIEEDRPDFTARTVEAFATRAPFQWTGRMTVRGEVRWIRFDSRSHLQANGNVIRTGIVEDVTESKKAERVIHEERTLFASLINGLPGIFYLFDLQGRFVRWNRNFEIVSGYSPEEMASRHPLDFFTGEEKDLVERRIREVFEKGEASVEASFTSRNGARTPYFLTGMRTEVAGRPHLIGMGLDMTERKRVEGVREGAYRISEVAGSVGTLDEFFARAHEIVGTLIPASNFYVALLDKETGTLSFPYFVDEADTRPSPRPLGRGLTEFVIRTGEPLLASPEVFNDLMVRGEVEALGAPSIDWLGAPLKVSGVTIGAVVVQTYTAGLRYGAADKDFLSFISGQLAMSIERKRAEIAERDAERRFQLLAEATSEGIAISENGTIIDCNPQYAALLGTSIQETVGRSLLEFVAPEFVGVLRERLRTGQVERIEVTALRRDGSRFPVEAEARIVVYQGRTLRIAVFRDLTDQRRSEAEIARIHRLHMALIGINEAIVRAQTQDELFREVPRVLVESGGFKMVRMGWCDSASPRVLVVGSHGDDTGYLKSADVYTDERPEGLGATGTAIREGRTVVCNDFMNDPRTFPWREAASRAGWQASAAFPVRLAGKVRGALTVYAHEVNFFGNREATLLEQAATDISYALENLDREARRRTAEQALRANEELLRQSQAIARLGSYVLDVPAGRWSSSEILDEIFGIGPDFQRDIAGWASLFHPEFRDGMVRYFTEEVMGEGRRFEREYKIVRQADGEERWVFGIGELELDTEGRITRMVGTIQDVTERRRSEERFRLWSHVLENSAEGIFVIDGKGTIITVNPAFTELTGYPDLEVIGKSPEFLESGQHGPEFYLSIRQTIREIGRWQGEVWSRRKNGEVFPVWLSITAILGAEDKPSHFIGVFADITERKESADRIQYLATHDFLTGLPNRSLVDDLLREAVARAERKGGSVGVLFLDLDRFKTVNDSLGHLAGDILLQRVAERLGGCLRAGDTVSRLGGDEFLILLPEIERAQDVAAVAAKILQAMQGPFSLPGRDVSISPSIGIAVYPSDGEDSVALVKNADAAMYHAKERGRNNYQFFTPDMNTRAFEALAMESSLRRALDRDEFFLVYQPQVETATGRITGMEALVRWTHPDLGLVLPGRFISVAEERGLIVPIGEWVLRTACRQVRAWLDAGLPAVPVAVNVSALQFERGRFAESVGAILSETGLSAHYLELELTESIVMSEAEEMMAILVVLKEMGVRLAIDDFGTGFSSLSYLARLPIGRLKIDQSFVRDAGASPSARTIISVIVSMARSLGLRVIAEGVETDEQLRILTLEGCEEVQGYLLAAPIGASEITSLLKTQEGLTEASRGTS